MECCNGGDLFDLIASHSKEGGLSEHVAARVQVQRFFSEAPWLSVEPLNHQVNFEVTKSWRMKTTAKVTKNIKELEL